MLNTGRRRRVAFPFYLLADFHDFFQARNTREYNEQSRQVDLTSLIKSSRVISRMNWLKVTDVSGTMPVQIIRASCHNKIQTIPSYVTSDSDDWDRDGL
jgi:hypothetical protein